MTSCAIRGGIFFRRACPNPVVETCSHCGRPVCSQHLVHRMPPPDLCIECDADLRSATVGPFMDDRDRFRDPSLSFGDGGDPGPAPVEGGGGQFGGAGASGGWDVDDSDKAGFESERGSGASGGDDGEGSGFDAS